MKYHEKINLKSPIFKYNNTTTSRTPSKSPIKPAPNPTDLFQKVCCPNCKYGFKIIRQQAMKQNPTIKASTPNKNSKIRVYKEIETQTQGILTVSNNNSPTKSIVSQQRFSKTYDFSMGQSLKQYELSQVNEIMQSQNNENRQLKESEFKFKPLSLSPHSKFSKSKNLLKTLDAKGFQAQESLPMTKSPAKTVQYINPYYVHKQESWMRKEENLYQQTLPFRDEDELYANGTGSRKYSHGGNIEREPMGYGNGRGGESGMVSPHGESERLEGNNARPGEKDNARPGEGNNARPGEKADCVETPKSSYSKKPSQPAQKSPQKSPQYKQHRMPQPPQRMPLPLPAQDSSQVIPNPQYPATVSKKDSPQFAQLISELVLKNQQQQQVIKQLQEICRTVGEEVQMPSFCKMLALSE